jgi:transcriptional regulator GlxA family with amidase domain
MALVWNCCDCSILAVPAVIISLVMMIVHFASMHGTYWLIRVAGVLDGRRAATHWMYCARLAQRFPAVRVDVGPIFVV